jgi:hypothetical protein
MEFGFVETAELATLRPEGISLDRVKFTWCGALTIPAKTPAHSHTNSDQSMC